MSIGYSSGKEIAARIEIFAKCEDEGPMGARLTVYGAPPRICPGLGGWKRGGGVTWWTRVKGVDAATLCASLIGPQNPYMGLRLTDAGRILAIAQIGGPDVMDDDLAEADQAGRLNWRPV